VTWFAFVGLRAFSPELLESKHLFGCLNDEKISLFFRRSWGWLRREGEKLFVQK